MCLRWPKKYVDDVADVGNEYVVDEYVCSVPNPINAYDGVTAIRQTIDKIKLILARIKTQLKTNTNASQLKVAQALDDLLEAWSNPHIESVRNDDDRALLRNLLLGIDKELRMQLVNPLTDALVEKKAPDYKGLLATSQGLKHQFTKICESLDQFANREGEERWIGVASLAITEYEG